MFASTEKKIINNGYLESNRYLKKTELLLWAYRKNNVSVSLLWDSIYNDYVFSFPLQNSKYNYVIRFNSLKEGNRYMKYILEEYI
jgi:hypothetical protein